MNLLPKADFRLTLNSGSSVQVPNNVEFELETHPSARMSTDIHLHEQSDSRPRTKIAPKPSSIPTPFFYLPSEDGTDENLLILLHGLGTQYSS
jgi:hypothetical protein